MGRAQGARSGASANTKEALRHLSRPDQPGVERGQEATFAESNPLCPQIQAYPPRDWVCIMSDGDVGAVATGGLAKRYARVVVFQPAQLCLIAGLAGTQIGAPIRDAVIIPNTAAG